MLFKSDRRPKGGPTYSKLAEVLSLSWACRWRCTGLKTSCWLSFGSWVTLPLGHSTSPLGGGGHRVPGAECSPLARSPHSGALCHPVRGGPPGRGPPASQAWYTASRRGISFPLNSMVQTRQVQLRAAAVTPKLQAGPSPHCFHLLLIVWIQRQQETVNRLLFPECS